MDVGIDLSVASLSAFALEQGITKSWQSMSQAEKIALRYQYILQATQTQQGDFARTSTSMANSLRTLRAYVQVITETIGDGLASALRHVIGWMNTAAKAVLRVAKAFAVFMQTLFGKNISGAGAGMIDEDAFDNVSEDLGDSATSAGDTADGLGDASDNAEKLAKTLSVLPFDELNQLSKDSEKIGSSSGGSGGSGGGGGLGSLGDTDMGMLDKAAEAFDNSKLPEAVDAWAKRIKAAFEAHDWPKLGEEIAWGINKGIDKLYTILDPKNVEKYVLPWVRNFATVMNSLVDSIHWDKLGATLGRGFNRLLAIANTWLTSFNWKNLGRKLAEGANGLLSEINWGSLGSFFANKLNALWNTIYGFVSRFNWKGLGLALGRTANSLVGGINWRTISDALSTSLNGAFNSLWTFAVTFNWQNLVNGIVGGINRFIRKFKWEANGEAINSFLTHFVQAAIATIRGIDFYGLGAGIARMLQKQKWLTLLDDAARAIMNALCSLLKGLGSTPAGAIVSAIVRGLAIVTLAGKFDHFITRIYSILTNEKQVSVIGKGLSVLFEKALGIMAPVLTPIAPWILTIGAAFCAVTALIVNSKQKLPEASDAIKKIAEDCKSAKEKVESLEKEAAEAVKGVKTSIATNKRMAEPYIEILQNLATKTGKLTDEEIRLKDEAIAELNKIYPGLNENINTQDTNLSNVVKQIQSYIEQTEKMALAEVYYEKIKEATTALVEAEDAANTARKAHRETLEKQSAVQKEYNDVVQQAVEAGLLEEEALRNLNYTSGMSQQIFVKFRGETVSLADATKTLAEEYNQCSVDADTSRQATIDAVGAMQGAEQQVDSYAGSYASLKGKMGSATDSTDTFSNATENASRKATTAKEGVEVLKTAAKTVGDVFHSGISKVDNWASSVKNAGENADAAKTSSDDWQTSMSKSPSLWDTVKGVLAGVATSLVATFAKREEFDNAGKNSVDGWTSGFNEKLPEAVGAVATGATGLVTAFKSALGIASPSTVFKAQANFIPQGIAEGITLGTVLVQNAIKAIVEKMTAQFDTSMQTFTAKMKTDAQNAMKMLCETMKTTFDTNFKAFYEAAKTKLEEFVTTIVSVFTSGKPKVEDSVKKLCESMKSIFTKTLDETKKSVSENIGAIVKNIVDSLTKAKEPTVKAVTDLCKGIKDTFDKQLKEIKTKLETGGKDAVEKGLVKGFTDGFRSFKPVALINQAFDPVWSRMGEIKSAMKTAGGNIITLGLRDGVVSALVRLDLVRTLSGAFSEFFFELDRIASKARTYGEKISNAISDGVRSRHIVIPHVDYNWATVYYDNGSWVQYPRFYVDWYAKGGLFTNPTIAGFGEAGDEAALPLENSRVMNRIANAIVDNSNGAFGIDEATLVSAVAQGYVQAMMSNQGNERPVNVYATLYTENNEVLARAVQRGQQSIDYRNNPTPRYSY